MLPGEQPAESDLDSARKSKLNEALNLLSSARKKLVISNTKKPWFSIIDLNKSPEDSAVYRDSLKGVNEIKAALGMHPVQEETSISADAKYQQYLENAPHLRIWAEANPAAAAKFKPCPFDF